MPGTMPTERVLMEQAHVFWNCSAGSESAGTAAGPKGHPGWAGATSPIWPIPAPLTTDRGGSSTAQPLAAWHCEGTDAAGIVGAEPAE